MINHRHYTYDYRRPRPSNPTYLSSSVGNSLSYFAHRPSQLIDHPMAAEINREAAYHIQNQQQHHINPQRAAQPEMADRVNAHNPEDRYPSTMPQRKVNQSLEHQSPMSKNSEPLGSPSRGWSQNSRFSQLGANTLNGGEYHMPAFTEDEVYRKQEKRFNIITLKPREHEQILRQYPKLTLEDKDDYFYRRMELQRKEMEQSLYRDHTKQEVPAGSSH